MFAPTQPVPASYVPWRQEEGVRASNLMNISYSDRAHALRAQDLNHACLSGVPPPGLPSWPPKHLLSYPGDSRMTDNEAGDAANTASEQVALRHLETAGQVQPAKTTFGRDASGALTVSSVPQITPDVPPAQASQARVRIAEWEAHAPERSYVGDSIAPFPDEPLDSGAFGAAVQAVAEPAQPAEPVAPAEPAEPAWQSDHVTAMSPIDGGPVAMGAAVVRAPDPTWSVADHGLWVAGAIGLAAVVTATARALT